MARHQEKPRPGTTDLEQQIKAVEYYATHYYDENVEINELRKALKIACDLLGVAYSTPIDPHDMPDEENSNEED